MLTKALILTDGEADVLSRALEEVKTTIPSCSSRIENPLWNPCAP